ECRIALRRKTQPLINQTTAVILAGGESSRMGYTPKISLMLGDYSFGEQILYSLQCFDEVFLSLRESTPQKPLPLPVLTDIIPDIGAIGGIYTSLSLCKTPFVFVEWKYKFTFKAY
ncbi:MAG: NTP transferase domain-containing protein, partial [Oscillospiraceae bacterium]